MTNPVLDGLPQTPVSGFSAEPRHCPECMTAFAPVERGQLFCCKAHRVAWNNRATTRGAVLTPLAIVARVTRNGTRGAQDMRATGRRASDQQNSLIQRWRDEDSAAGRMPWAEYLRRRYDIGFDPL